MLVSTISALVLYMTLMLSSIILQIMALNSINKSSVSTENSSSAYKWLLSNVILTIIIFLAMIPMAIYAGNMDFGIVTTLAITMFVNGALSTQAAIKLQCDQSQDDNLHNAWSKSRWAAVLGILSSVVLMIVQLYMYRGKVKSQATKAYSEIKNFENAPIQMPIAL